MVVKRQKIGDSLIN